MSPQKKDIDLNISLDESTVQDATPSVPISVSIADMASRINHALSSILLTFALDTPLHTVNETETLRARFREERGLPPEVPIGPNERTMTCTEKLKNCIPLRVSQQGALLLCILWLLLMIIVPLRLELSNMLPYEDTLTGEIIIEQRDNGRYYTLCIMMILYLFIIPRICLLPLHILYAPVSNSVIYIFTLLNTIIIATAIICGIDLPFVLTDYVHLITFNDRMMWIGVSFIFICTLSLPIYAYSSMGRFEQVETLFKARNQQLALEDVMTSLPAAKADEITRITSIKIIGIILSFIYILLQVIHYYLEIDTIGWLASIYTICMMIILLISSKHRIINDPYVLFIVLFGSVTVPIDIGRYFLRVYMQSSEFWQLMYISSYTIISTIIRILFESMAKLSYTPVRCMTLVYSFQQTYAFFSSVIFIYTLYFSEYFFYTQIVVFSQVFLSSSGFWLFIKLHLFDLLGKSQRYTQLQIHASEVWHLEGQEFLSQITSLVVLLVVTLADIGFSDSVGLSLLTKDYTTFKRAKLLLVLLYLIISHILLRPITTLIRNFLLKRLPISRMDKYTVYDDANDDEDPLPSPPIPPSASSSFSSFETKNKNKNIVCFNCEKWMAEVICNVCNGNEIGYLCINCDHLLHMSLRYKNHERNSMYKKHHHDKKSKLHQSSHIIHDQTIAATPGGMIGLRAKLRGLNSMQNSVNTKVFVQVEEECKEAKRIFVKEEKTKARKRELKAKGLIYHTENGGQRVLVELHFEKVDRDGRARTVLFEGQIFIYILSVSMYCILLSLFHISTLSFEYKFH